VPEENYETSEIDEDKFFNEQRLRIKEGKRPTLIKKTTQTEDSRQNFINYIRTKSF